MCILCSIHIDINFFKSVEKKKRNFVVIDISRKAVGNYVGVVWNFTESMEICAATIVVALLLILHTPFFWYNS